VLSTVILAFATVMATVLGVWLTNSYLHNQQREDAKKRWDLLLYTLREFPLHRHNEEEDSGLPLTETNLRYPKTQINGSGR
jgi:hypothetical protein